MNRVILSEFLAKDEHLEWVKLMNQNNLFFRNSLINFRNTTIARWILNLCEEAFSEEGFLMKVLEFSAAIFSQ
jgi:hypothetical protein